MPRVCAFTGKRTQVGWIRAEKGARRDGGVGNKIKGRSKRKVLPNLKKVKCVIGGYATFVSKLDLDDHVDRPAWLDHIDPGTLKTKLAGALIGVSGIHLLQTFTTLGEALKKAEVAAPDYHLVQWQVIIHLTFVISTIILALADYILEKKLALAHREGIEDRAA